MNLESLDLPMMTGRVAIAASALLHTLFATFIVGSSLIGAITATCSYVTRKEWFGRLAHVIAFALVLSTATISFMGVALVFFLNIYWPQFWHRIFNTMFWPFLGEAALFFGEAVFAYSWYYLWDWGQQGWRQKAHLSFIWIAAGCALVAMFMIDITASYMLTPSPVYGAWGNILNPTMLHLHVHRWFGNITWAGFAIAGICAIGYLKAKTDQDSIIFQKGGRYCFLFAYGALLVMPVVGYQYLLNLRYGQPQAFFTLMLGERSWLFDLVGLLYGLLVLVGSLYIARMVRSQPRPPESFAGFFPLSLAVIVLSAIILAMPYHLHHLPFLNQFIDQEINPLGKMQPYKYFALSGLVILGFGNWLYGLVAAWRSGNGSISGIRSGATRQMASLLMALAVMAMLIMLAMGWVRESARAVNGYLIYDVMRLKDEKATYQKQGASETGIFSKEVPYQPFER
jgi:cytochrome d ubiquinol oxidase subunit I